MRTRDEEGRYMGDGLLDQGDRFRAEEKDRGPSRPDDVPPTRPQPPRGPPVETQDGDPPPVTPPGGVGSGGGRGDGGGG